MSDEAKSGKTEASAQEPSMEDILTSIRRILSEEGESDPGARASEATDEDVDPDEAGDRPLPPQPGAEPDDEGVMDEPPPERARAAASRPAEARDTGRVLDLTPEMRLPRVVSTPTQAASADVLAELAKAILDRRDIAVGGRDVTLEGMVREMLRPLLREWLDRNLPYLIERLVRKEIDAMINRAERLDD